MSSKFEAGQFWRTRVGKKAKVLQVGSPFDDGRRAIVVWMEDYGVGYWELDGSFISNTRPHDFDLIEPWRDPVTRTVDLLLCKVRADQDAPARVFFGNTDNHPNQSIYRILAHKHIVLTEGEFDDASFKESSP